MMSTVTLKINGKTNTLTNGHSLIHHKGLTKQLKEGLLHPEFNPYIKPLPTQK